MSSFSFALFKRTVLTCASKVYEPKGILRGPGRRQIFSSAHTSLGFQSKQPADPKHFAGKTAQPGFIEGTKGLHA